LKNPWGGDVRKKLNEHAQDDGDVRFQDGLKSRGGTDGEVGHTEAKFIKEKEKINVGVEGLAGMTGGNRRRRNKNVKRFIC
jgi:hypothetical protein